jgi:hypothetical protein
MRWTLRHRLSRVTLLALAVLGMMVMAELASASHVRPKGATPVRVYLVPAYRQCTSSNRTHGTPLAFPSCSPPVQASNFLTVGTPDANGAGANSVGFLLLKVNPASTNNVTITSTISDVRCLPGTAAGVCNSANTAGGPDYSGGLQGNAWLRISDHYNGSSLTEAATVVDLPFPINMTCANTADTSIGGLCSIPPNAVQPALYPQGTSTRAVAQLTQIQIFDGGADGQAGTTADNTLFEVQGIFIP